MFVRSKYTDPNVFFFLFQNKWFSFSIISEDHQVYLLFSPECIRDLNLTLVKKKQSKMIIFGVPLTTFAVVSSPKLNQ